MKALILAIYGLIFISGCQTARMASDHLDGTTASAAFDVEVSFDRGIQKKYPLLSNQTLSDYIGSVLLQISRKGTSGAILQKDNIVVRVLSSKKCFLGISPKNHVYVSLGVLNLLQYENELGFLLSMALEIRHSGYVQKYYDALGLKPNISPEKYFEPDGVFDFGGLEYLKIKKQSLKHLYAAGYDLRGAITIIDRVFEKHRPPTAMKLSDVSSFRALWYEASELKVIMREEVAKFPPIRDPIVKSREFEKFLSSVRKINSKI